MVSADKIEVVGDFTALSMRIRAGWPGILLVEGIKKRTKRTLNSAYRFCWNWFDKWMKDPRRKTDVWGILDYGSERHSEGQVGDASGTPNCGELSTKSHYKTRERGVYFRPRSRSSLVARRSRAPKSTTSWLSQPERNRRRKRGGDAWDSHS